MAPRGVRPMALLLALFCLFVFVSAQFQFRFHTGGQQHREEESEDDKIEKARELAKKCKYVCPDTGACSSSPKACACPRPSQTKCSIGDWYVCLEHPRKCSELQ